MTKTITCGRCNATVTLNKFQSKLYQKKKIKIPCPVCKYFIIPKSELPPTMAQLKYIQALGGSITGIATNGQAKNKINELLRIKYERENKRASY